MAKVPACLNETGIQGEKVRQHKINFIDPWRPGMPEGKLSHYSSKAWKCRMEDRVNGATRWCIVRRERPAINFPEFKSLASKGAEVELAAKTLSCWRIFQTELLSIEEQCTFTFRSLPSLSTQIPLERDHFTPAACLCKQKQGPSFIYQLRATVVIVGWLNKIWNNYTFLALRLE